MATQQRNNGGFGSFLETFGAVPVGGQNLYKLLEGGEAALLYPGGVREVRAGVWCGGGRRPSCEGGR